MVFVTGGTGFIGSYLLYYLLRDNPTVTALKRTKATDKYTRFIFEHLAAREPMSNGETWQQAYSRVAWVEGDILDADSLHEAMQGAEIVYHAAAIVSYDRRMAKKMLETNIEGTANLVNACLDLGVGKLAYVSSIAALGSGKPGEAIDETPSGSESGFSNTYAESKYRAEMEVWRGQAEGLDVVVLNPGVVLGWGDFTQSSPAMFRTVYKGLKFYPTGSTAFIDVRDVARILIRLAHTPAAQNQRYIAIAETLSYETLFDMMAAALRVPPPTIRVSPALVTGVWLLAETKALLTRSTPFVTRDMAISSGKNHRYNGDKLKKLLPDYTFVGIGETVREVGEVYLGSL